MAPRTAVSRPIQYRVDHLIHAFRMRLGRIGGVTRDDLETWLGEQDWDLDVAIDYFNQYIALTARHAHESNQPGRTLLERQKDDILAGASYSRHGNHRRTISVLYEMLQLKYPNDPSIDSSDRMTAMRIANLLRETFFDYEEAILMHKERRLNVAQMAEVDRAERRLCMRGPGGAEPIQVHKDTRVQIFLEVAGTDDWVAARNFLSSGAIVWNLGVALERWMQSGLPNTPATAAEIRRARYRAPQLKHAEQNNLWPAPRPLFRFSPPDAADIADSLKNYGQGSYADQVSRFINLEPYNTIVGINRSDLLE